MPQTSYRLSLCLAFGLFFTFNAMLQAQEIKSLSFNEFQEEIQQESDTLYLYNFWATWCRPCVAELPYFEALNKAYADQKFKIILVSLDFANQKENLLPFMQKKGFSLEVWHLYDAHKPHNKGWIDKISPEWGGSIPASLLSQPSKDIYDFKETAFIYETLEAWVTSHL